MWNDKFKHYWNKAKLIADFNSNLDQDPSYLSGSSKKWDRVFVDGVWDESKQILVDNSINRGVAGFKVLTPLKIKNEDRAILVDRGWVAQNIFRNELPNIGVQKNEISVSGILENPELGFVLSDDLVTSTWPKISQTKHLNVVSKEYNMDLEPFILVADYTADDYQHVGRAIVDRVSGELTQKFAIGELSPQELLDQFTSTVQAEIDFL